ncbi:MAG: hypothetical protein KC502_22470 [Myxococcales bacterium]|nr:hypothetical protein [Myxococcales bacterium]
MPADSLAAPQPRALSGPLRSFGWLTALALMTVSGAAHAASPTDVVLRCPPAARARLAAELQAVGLQATTGAPTTDHSALHSGSVAAVVSTPADLSKFTIEVRSGSQITRHTLQRRPAESVGSVALRVAEHVHALLADVRAETKSNKPPALPPSTSVVAPTAPRQPSPDGAAAASKPNNRIGRRTGGDSQPRTTRTSSSSPAHVPNPDTRKTPTPKATTPKAKPPQPGAPRTAKPISGVKTVTVPVDSVVTSWWSLRGGVAADAALGGLGAAAAGRFSVTHSLPNSPNLATGLLLDVPVSKRGATTTAGESLLTVWTIGAELRWRALRKAKWSGWLEGGAGLAMLSAEGRAGPGHQGLTASSRTAVVWAGGAVERQLSSLLHIRVEASALTLGGTPVLMTDSTPSARWGRPALRVALCLEVRP